MCLRGHGQGGYLGLELKSTTLKPDDAEGVTKTGTVQPPRSTDTH